MKEELSLGEISKQLEESLRTPSGYLTIDLRECNKINAGGLRPILEAAAKLKIRDKGCLQLIYVPEGIYHRFINTKILGKRLPYYAELYTNRTVGEIDTIINSIVKNHSRLEVERQQLVDKIHEAEEDYERLHRNDSAHLNSEREVEAWKKEYVLRRCINLIEETYPDVLDHLGYRYGKVDKIKRLGRIEDIPGFKSALSSEMGNREEGICVLWVWRKDYGFIRPDRGGDDLIVYVEDAPERKGLGRGKRYSYMPHYNKRKDKWRARNVKPL